MSTLITGNVLWTFDEEIESSNNLLAEILAMFSGSLPFHRHHGEIVLTPSYIEIIGDIDLSIALKDITELFLGFDEVYKRSYAKNGGLFWQPLRVTFQDGKDEKIIYLIIDKGFSSSNNGFWFETLKSLY